MSQTKAEELSSYIKDKYKLGKLIYCKHKWREAVAFHSGFKNRIWQVKTCTQHPSVGAHVSHETVCSASYSTGLDGSITTDTGGWSCDNI